jgi:hypothetical protein
MFLKVVPVFLHIISAPLYTFAIACEASLCPFQKKFVVARPTILAQKVFHRRLYIFFLIGSI